jgi:hypothetical protein
MKSKLILLLVALAALSINAKAQEVPEPKQTNLFSRVAYRDTSRSAVNFESGKRGHGTRDYFDFDLLYGSAIIADDIDWFEVCDPRSQIYDLGRKRWEDFKETPPFPKSKGRRKPMPLSGDVKEIDVSGDSKEISPYAQYVRVNVGHMYLMKVKREQTTTYVMLRVDDLITQDNVTFSWKKVTPPEQDPKK